MSTPSIHFTNSEFQTFKQCKRKWYLGHYRKLAPRRRSMSKALNTGTLIHEAVRVFYREGQDADKALTWLDERKVSEMEDSLDADRQTIKEGHEMARAVFEGYVWWLENTGADHRLKVLSVEKKFEVDGPVEGTKLLGKFDLEGEDTVTGEGLVMDHKSVQSFGLVIPTLNIEEQGPFYLLIRSLAELDAKPITKVIWNMMRKTKRGAKSKPPFYARQEVYVTKPMLDRLWTQIYGQILDIHRVEEELDSGADPNIVVYPSPHRDCSYSCQFFAVCGAMNDPRSDAEHLIDIGYVKTNPLQRYEEDNEAIA